MTKRNLLDTNPREPEKSKIINLMRKERFDEAYESAQRLAPEHPGDPEYPIFQGVALINLADYRKAYKVMQKAVKKFPEDWQCHEVLGLAHGHLGEWAFAEQSYQRALELIPKGLLVEQGMLYVDLAHALWEEHHRDEAIAAWRKAVEIDPSNTEAHESLKEFVNAYGEAKAPNEAFDDMYHFRTIQMQRYFQLVGRNEFVSPEEAQQVFGVIMEGWNKHIPPRARDMDAMSPAEKSEWFKQITLDFNEVVQKWKSVSH